MDSPSPSRTRRPIPSPWRGGSSIKPCPGASTRSVAQERKRSFALPLDSRAAKPPGGNDLALPTLAAARALANEWPAVGEIIDPALMPLTRLVNSAIDGVAPRLAITVAEIAKYAGSDLVCYRAGEPQALAYAQADAWDPILAFAQKSSALLSFARKAWCTSISRKPPA